MPYIPSGSYRFPLGILLVSESENYSAMIRIYPNSKTIPEKVNEFTLFWNGEIYDGSEVGFESGGISDEESEDLPSEYRYEGYIDGEDEEEEEQEEDKR